MHTEKCSDAKHSAVAQKEKKAGTKICSYVHGHFSKDTHATTSKKVIKW